MSNISVILSLLNSLEKLSSNIDLKSLSYESGPTFSSLIVLGFCEKKTVFIMLNIQNNLNFFKLNLSFFQLDCQILKLKSFLPMIKSRNTFWRNWRHCQISRIWRWNYLESIMIFNLLQFAGTLCSNSNRWILWWSKLLKSTVEMFHLIFSLQSLSDFH